ncbi:MAG: MoxR family ATPase [Acidobacteriota bacterium]|nr:MoxR family ATPase [Acidobacteriota bacterium]
MSDPSIKEQINLNVARLFQAQLADVGHQVALQEAFDVANWFHMRRGPLILEGEPGSGKSELLKRVATVSGAELYWIQCYEQVGAGEVLYTWNKLAQRWEAAQARREKRSVNWWDREHLIPGKMARALISEAQLVMVVFDEIDKIPEGSQLEAALLGVTVDQRITINESRDVIKRRDELPPILIGFTSNAGEGQLRESLSAPLRRRSKLMSLEHPDAVRMEKILRSAVPGLNDNLRRQVAIYLHCLRADNWDKKISLSEGIEWAATLAHVGCAELSTEVIEWTRGDVVKGEQELKRLREANKRLVKLATEKAREWEETGALNF